MDGFICVWSAMLPGVHLPSEGFRWSPMLMGVLWPEDIRLSLLNVPLHFIAFRK